MRRWGCACGHVIARAALFAASVVLVVPASAQTAEPPPPSGAATYSAPQLDQMLAPIALYPDDLLGQILMAATYPLEIVQADRWLQNPSNAALRGNDLAQALQPMPWDASVKSLAAYPQLLSWMDNGLDWTEAVGDAFLAQQSDVMDSVQRLRARAQSAGTLSSTPQETVNAGDQGIQIASGDQNVEYVPVYNPQAAYGDWPYPDYPPDEFYAPGYEMGTFLAFPILVGFWGWDRPDWRHHRIDVDPRVGPGFDHDRGRYHDHGRGGPPPVAWRHDPSHRGGVPYRDPVTRARFEGAPDTHVARTNSGTSSRSSSSSNNNNNNFRGYPSRQPAPSATAPARPAVPQAIARAPVPERSMPAPEARRPPPEMVRPQPPAPRPQAAPRPAPVERAMPPAMESFGRGEQVRVQEQRGFASRVEPPHAAAPAPAPAPGGVRHR